MIKWGVQHSPFFMIQIYNNDDILDSYFYSDLSQDKEFDYFYYTNNKN